MKSYGRRDIAPLIIEKRWRWVRCFGRKSPRFPLSRNWNWMGRTAGSDVSLEMKICCPCRELNHDYALIQPVIWSLYPLRCLGSHFPRCLKNVLEIFSVWGGIWSRDLTTLLWNLVSVRSVFLCLEYYAWRCINGVEVKFYAVKGCGLKWGFEIYASSLPLRGKMCLLHNWRVARWGFTESPTFWSGRGFGCFVGDLQLK